MTSPPRLRHPDLHPPPGAEAFMNGTHPWYPDPGSNRKPRDPMQYHRSSPSQSSARSIDESRERRRPRSRHRSHSSERERSPSPRHKSHYIEVEEEKPWFKKKTIWTTVATLASVAALVPASLSARASQDAALASTISANASKRSAKAVVKSSKAVINTSVAQGHQDHRGRYTGPRKDRRDRDEEDSRRSGRGERYVPQSRRY